MGSDHCVIMFVKSPEKGLVKSRLAARLGETIALDLYRCFVEDLLGMLARHEYALIVSFHPPEAGQRIVQWLGDGHALLPQAGEDLGERMKNAFRSVFSRGREAAVLIGSDSPDLPGEIIDEALASLRDHDVVTGPSYDGGYYLIGFRADAFLPSVFEGMPWSTPGVYEQTLDVLQRAGLRIHVLPKWRDIDTYDDLAALFSASRNTGFSESATIRYVKQHIPAITGRPDVDVDSLLERKEMP